MKIGIVGWRGMVGSVLMDRMVAEGDFEGLSPTFYSTSQAGQQGPSINGKVYQLESAFELDKLKGEEVILSTQGGGYTKEIFSQLRKAGWQGFWVDAASTLRMDPDSLIVLDPVNRSEIVSAIKQGGRTYIGGNCTVSLLLMALAPLIKAGWVEWISSMTYQAASGAGAAQMKELVEQSGFLVGKGAESSTPLELDRVLRREILNPELPQNSLGAPLAFNLLPYIDSEYELGQSREEWKGGAELNKLLGLEPIIPVDGVCVRVPVLRCHSQAFTLKLKTDISLSKIEEAIASAHEWIELVPNLREPSLERLTPAYVSGSLKVVVGRLKKSLLGPEYVTGFTVGDQLLWGAAEPLRRVVQIVKEEALGHREGGAP